MSRTEIPNLCNRNRTMIESLAFALALVIGSAASVTHAQAPAGSFADAFASMQSLSSNSSNWQREAPYVSNSPRESFAGLSMREMQALSSDSPSWSLDHGKIEVDRGQTFAQTHPHGLSFPQYQAYASNSDEFALPPTVRTSTLAAKEPLKAAESAVEATGRERIARVLLR